MARTKRGFIMQSFLPGGIKPSSASVPASFGQAPTAPTNMGSGSYSPAMGSASQPSKMSQSQITGAIKTQKAPQFAGNALSVDATQAPTLTKFQQLQGSLGGISGAPKTLGMGTPSNLSSMLGADAGSTDWASLFGYQGYNSSALQNILKQMGISSGPNYLGGQQSYGSDWLKQMGLA